MVPVRKPGRPLSACPHPSSKPCSCGAVTAAIPRKQKCGCGSSAKETPSATAAKREDSDSAATTPTDESRASTHSFRIHKPGNRKGSARKPSIDPAGLGRMDAGQMNIIPSFDGAQGDRDPMGESMTSTHGKGGTQYGSVGVAPSDNSFGGYPMMLPAFAHPMAPPTAQPGQAEPAATNGHASHTPNGLETPTRGGCCGGGSKTSSSEASPAPAEVDANGQAEAANGSCCSPKKAGQKTAMQAPAIAQTPHQQPMMFMPPFQAPMPMHNGMYPFFPQPTVFTYPPQYGTYMQPLQPEQWRQVMAALSFGQPVPVNGFGIAETPASGTMPNPSPGVAPYPSKQHESAVQDDGTSHHCTCGESCQCVGCAAHPYNEATQNYVHSAWSSMMEQQPGVNHVNANGNGSSHHHQDEKPIGKPPSPESMPPPTSQTETNSTSTTPQTPSDGASALGEEQVFSPNDFFFVSYPFGGTCAGDTVSCPCGDDCQCIGCVIHGNLDPAAVPEQPAN